MTTPNPWGLTEAEEEALSLYVESGDNHAVAVSLGITPNAASSRIHNARVKMSAPNSVVAVITYERWAAGAAA